MSPVLPAMRVLAIAALAVLTSALPEGKLLVDKAARPPPGEPPAAAAVLEAGKESAGAVVVVVVDDSAGLRGSRGAGRRGETREGEKPKGGEEEGGGIGSSLEEGRRPSRERGERRKRSKLSDESSPFFVERNLKLFEINSGQLQSGSKGQDGSSRQAGSQDTPDLSITAKDLADADAPAEKETKNEAFTIQPRNIAFFQPSWAWEKAGHGISLTAKGEPKSGTTWLGRLIPQLALELCGSETNEWCEMGGLVVHPNEPAPYYEFEMLSKGRAGGGGGSSKPTLFMHFKGIEKHVIPGAGTKNEKHGCHHGGSVHRNFFEEEPPCLNGISPTREKLVACLWSTSTRCLQFMPSTDMAVRRTAVIFRDPRDVIISELKMRVEFYKERGVSEVSLDDYILRRFETIVSWTHQRWMWHTATVFGGTSHVMFYEDLQESYFGIIYLASFMGLGCSPEQAKKVWLSHQSANPHGDYTTHDLRHETVVYMNATMARLLPEPVALRWGLTLTDL